MKLVDESGYFYLKISYLPHCIAKSLFGPFVDMLFMMFWNVFTPCKLIPQVVCIFFFNRILMFSNSILLCHRMFCIGIL